ncbi:aminotransferase-like domain-containing protein [Sediminitomix flava]|uniref:GntR family transcriptional regulator/MocR family aminotransferase n=1 Tax=Sediminitomix flava TaxID=379075 RepID=A0A315ZJ28_SEDFL|nr:PLP-dependent aminotransferase family protein [Sediminitomix flava]PWJ33659.1 GntR family transcriptional regulator/MocR family aminotransferase [Sediminitomix flava]
MLPFSNLIQIDRESSEVVYRQIYRQFIQLIKDGVLQAGTKLPSTRELAKSLKVNRMTLMLALDELESQDWVESKARKGIFISSSLPMNRAVALGESEREKSKTTGFQIPEQIYFRQHQPQPYLRKLDEGLPDVRLAPLKELGQNYKQILGSASHQKLLSYGSALGDDLLREELVKFLNDSRGLHTSYEQLAIVRGSQMALRMLSEMLIRTGDKIAVGESNYIGADATFLRAGADLVRIPVDQDGVVVEKLADICQKEKIRGIYLTPHHHHPTTVTLSAERRIQLLSIAEQYGLFILEDDYDYDFHYSRSPYLPLASIDQQGHVIYIGSFTKMLAPNFRVGFISAPSDLVKLIEQERILSDRQGDFVLERSIAHLLRDGVIHQHLRKVLKVYQNRRDTMSELLNDKLSSVVEFEIPKGGMAIWGEFDQEIDLAKVSDILLKKHALLIPDFKQYNTFNLLNSQGIRFGFASQKEEEMNEIIGIMSNHFEV